MKYKPKKHKQRRKWPIVLAIVGGCVLLLVIVAAIYVGSIAGKMKQVNVSDDEFGITTSAETKTTSEEQDSEKEQETETEYIRTNIKNIVFLGIDEEENRSDTMMVLSVGLDDNSLRIVSILRDSKVQIEGCKFGTKIGYAYKWGGSTLAVKTINQNFHTSYNEYVAMDFNDIEDAIDLLGGVDIELTSDEAAVVNSGAATRGYYGYDAVEGWNHLNGVQAVAHSRNRSSENGEVDRVNRQQVVLNAMFNSLKNVSVTQYPEIIGAILECIETTLTYDELINLAFSIDVQNINTSRFTIPDANYETDLWGGWETVENWEYQEECPIDECQWVWIYDIEAAGKRLRDITEK